MTSDEATAFAFDKLSSPTRQRIADEAETQVTTHRGRIENQFNKLGVRVLAVLGRQQWLDRPSYRIEHLLSFLFYAVGGARERIANVLHGVWLGHPVHPPLASLTSGAIGTTVALDAISVLPGLPRTEVIDASRFAKRALGLGLLANLAAAVTGATDWQHTHERERRIGLVHGALNVLAIALYARSWWNRHQGRHWRGITISALGYGITAATSYLGGALVFESGIGIDQSGQRLETDDWIPVLPEASLRNGKPLRVDVDGIGLVLCKTDDGSVAAFGEFCPHLAAPMADGWIDRGQIVCPWHGSRFAADSGEVVRGPATAPLPCYLTRFTEGMIEIRSGSHNSPVAGKGVVK